MTKEKKIFSCQECGYATVRWLGKCPSCGAWNSFHQETISHHGPMTEYEKQKPVSLGEIKVGQNIRIPIGTGELDRVLGGGLVGGSVILLAGEPGIGKSTLVLLSASKLSGQGKKVLYVSAEESLDQLAMRADRLGVKNTDSLFFLTENEIKTAGDALETIKPDVVIVDSIQMMYDSEFDYPYGSIFQVRRTAQFFIEWAKRHGSPVFLIGHITKEGNIAGPKILEHLVDVVLYFEGDKLSNLRVLRAIKNRFGSTDEIGVFRMDEHGLIEVPDSARLFLSTSSTNQPGLVVFPAQEGKRTILLEIQSLITPSYLGVPRRTFTGLDYNRVNLVLAVIEKKLRMNLASRDIYFNVAGGLKIAEPGVDLAIAIASISSYKDIPAVSNTVFIGEIALTGEIRPVQHIVSRLKEALRLGFRQAFIPLGSEITSFPGMNIVEVSWLGDLPSLAFEKG
ncbi:MAG TPA: DNA repair protein RadA [bacterium]|nr:DNA repair protein RadA [bacterium]HOL49117.1 DNA repair protein RadA [bacterium]HPO52098.1 DNA repair protein RadA [bacterium]